MGFEGRAGTLVIVLDYRVDNGVALLVFNRPGLLNAFDDELGGLVRDSVEQAASDEAVRCVLITGAGRAFSAGEDLSALAAAYEAGQPPDLGHILRSRYNPLILALRGAPKPVVAALNGVAAGAGASVALACDYRIASERATLAFPFAKVGLVPDSGATWFLVRMVGLSRAQELVQSGRAVGAVEALRLGLVHEVVPADELEARSQAVALELSQSATYAFGLTKTILDQSWDRSLEEQLEAEAEAQGMAGGTRDHLEGVRAFLSKRAPEFQGH
jgi:2-(1,2-epoxy-1,2-dihydrophenyl)acetyl-CoA isomerase